MKPLRILTALSLCVLSGGLFPFESIAQTSLESEIQILQRLAEERYAEGDLKRAADIYQEIAAKHTDFQEQAKALFTAAWLNQLSGDSATALVLLTRSLAMVPDLTFNKSLYDREFALLYQQALHAAQRERQLESTEKTQAAVAELKAGRLPEARALLESAVNLDHDNASALYNLALLDLRAGASPKALGDFERVVSLTYKETTADMTELRAKALTSIGLIYQKEGRLDDAEQSYHEATRADSAEASAWMNLGLLQYQQNRFEVASTTLAKAQELLPENRQVVLSLARSLEASGGADQAAASLRSYLQRQPGDAEAWQQLGQIEERRDDIAAAIQALEKSMAADEENVSGVAIRSAILLASIHLDQESVEAALAPANRAVGWDRNNSAAWSVLGRAQLAAGQQAQGTASLTRAAELDSGSLERQMDVADALRADGQLAQAEAAYLRALTLDPSSIEAEANLELVRQKIANERAIVSGKVRRPRPIAPKKIGLEFAGIDYKDLQLRGALVKQVNKKSPAARAGLRKGDLILWIGDYSILSGKDFFQYLKRSPPGETLDLEYLRDGRIHDVELHLR